MRGSDTGALDRTYLHSAISAALWYAVAEAERMRDARLLHAVMLASLYGNPSATLSKGNDQVHEMYVSALETIPYFRLVTRKAAKRDTDELVDEWRKANAEGGKKVGGKKVGGEEGDDAVRQ